MTSKKIPDSNEQILDEVQEEVFPEDQEEVGLDVPETQLPDQDQEEVGLDVPETQLPDQDQEEVGLDVPETQLFDQDQEEVALDVPETQLFDQDQEEVALDVPETQLFDQDQEEVALDIPETQLFDQDQEEVALDIPETQLLDQDQEAFWPMFLICSGLFLVIGVAFLLLIFLGYRRKESEKQEEIPQTPPIAPVKILKRPEKDRNEPYLIFKKAGESYILKEIRNQGKTTICDMKVKNLGMQRFISADRSVYIFSHPFLEADARVEVGIQLQTFPLAERIRVKVIWEDTEGVKYEKEYVPTPEE